MIIRPLLRFGIVGLLTTLISYATFMLLLRFGVHYLPASGASWVASLCSSFVLNRHYTFDIRGRRGRARDFGVFVVGAITQLIIGLLGYALLMGRLGLSATPAFILNLAVTSAYSFVFMRWITFRSRYRTPPSDLAA